MELFKHIFLQNGVLERLISALNYALFTKKLKIKENFFVYPDQKISTIILEISQKKDDRNIKKN